MSYYGIFNSTSFVLLRVEVSDEAPPPGVGEYVQPLSAAFVSSLAVPRADYWRVRLTESEAVWFDPRPLNGIKQDKADELRAAAAANGRLNITAGSATFEADPEALDELAREAFFARIDGDAYALTWKRASGNWITLTAAQTIALARAIRDRAETIRQQLRDKLGAVAAAATAAEVEAIAWVVVP